MCSKSPLYRLQWPAKVSVAGLFVPDVEWRWRMPCLLQVMGPSIVFAILIFAPESPRWLASKGRTEQARAVLVKHHANGDDEDPLVEWQFGEIVSTLQQEQDKNKSRYVSHTVNEADNRSTSSRPPEIGNASG
jgi:hypothetical protein